MANVVDYLNRTKEVNELADLVKRNISEDHGMAFAINGKWGSGKTFLIDLLKESLSNEYYVFQYDAWDNNYYEDPLVGILDFLACEINKIRILTVDAVSKKVLKDIGVAIGKFLNEALYAKTGVDFIHCCKKINKIIQNNKISTDFNEYSKVKYAKSLIIETLNKLGKIKPVIFIVDELDRCIPTYTLKIIERIHHISNNVKRCVTIFSVDQSQLNSIIQNIYGKDECDSNAYLRKIIDFSYNLNLGQLNNDFFKEFDTYLEYFEKPHNGITEEEIKSDILELFSNKQIRDVLNIIRIAKLNHEITYGNERYGKELMCAEIYYALLIKEYPNSNQEILFSDILNKKDKPLINYITRQYGNYYSFYHNDNMERNYVNIVDLRGLVLYSLLQFKNYLPMPVRIQNLPNWTTTIKKYLENLEKTKY